MEEVTLSLLIILKRSSIYPLDRNFMLNFKPGEYMGKMFFFKSVTQATGKKKTPPQNNYHHVSILRISTYRNSRHSSMLDERSLVTLAPTSLMQLSGRASRQETRRFIFRLLF